MSAYLITYNVKNNKNTFECLHKIVKEKFHGHWNCMEHIFIIISEDNSSQIRDYFSSCLNDDDLLLVIKLAANEDREADWYGLSQECEDWLNDNI